MLPTARPLSKTRILAAFAFVSSQQGIEDTLGHAQQTNLVSCRGHGLRGHKSRCLAALLGCFAGDALGLFTVSFATFHLP